jgi:hypothetical protein
VAGSGIGLAVVAELVRGHGGDVQAISTPALGTQIIVTLPGADRLTAARSRHRGRRRPPPGQAQPLPDQGQSPRTAAGTPG